MDHTRNLIAIAALASSASLAPAGIVSVTGGIEQIAPPADVTFGATESSTHIRMFQERSFYELPVAVQADLTAPGEWQGSLTPGFVLPGEVIDVHYLHLDPVGSDFATFPFEQIVFDQDVLGIIVSDQFLSNSDFTLGNAGTAYPNAVFDRGLEAADFVGLAADLRTVTIDIFDSPEVDNIRIVTRAPAPGAVATLALAGLVGGRRRR